ncbi:hypothetical protein VPNG_05691 [Cytospora leucostoma]|uniref:Peptidase S26 domain-containing protein n=1 Tax=Cytospora leucostoma TaxID=1230097 RepID=A0A423X0A4_9PEZI|nr:hypothetical protein VPNG_05691 [Cytospora leucostoma]
MSTFSRRSFGRYYGHPFHLFADAAKVLAAAHLFWVYGYDWGRVSGPSMLPGWSVWGEGAIISHWYRRGKGIQNGDLVRFKIPINDEVAIKRVLGLPGDYVLINTPESGSDAMIQVGEVRGIPVVRVADDGAAGSSGACLVDRRQSPCITGLAVVWSGSDGFD